ncbi:MAG TPA: DUF927 domain-containing protein, partial [Planctomycetaceae bacterium]|nr:DUF927 domain-containing protein [Planctomycetaceae bacterium]
GGAQSILVQLRRASVQGMQQRSPIKSVLPDAPVADNAVVPDDYLMTPDGVMRVVGEQRVPVSSAPILITQRCRDIDTGCQQLTVSWRRDGKWASCTADRSKIADRGTIIGSLANFGAPVNSANSSALVEYLAAYECTNAATLEPVATTSQLGWHALDGTLVFLLGSQLLGVARESGHRAGENDPTTKLQFVPADVGDRQLAEAIHTHGTFDGWKRAVRRVAHHPRILLVLFASLAAPLLKLLHVPSFVTDLCGETSMGKTTSLRLAASPWGNPSDADSGRPSLLLSWDATRVFLERAPAILQNLPLFVDESKRAARPELVVQKIYDFCGGTARGRGKPTGVDKMPSWNTAMFTTGEQPIVSLSEDGGTRARVIELFGPPFGAADAATGAVVNRLQADLAEHYGFAGPALLVWLLARSARRTRLTRRYGEIREELVAAAGNNPIGIRLAAPLAAILVTEEFAHEALSLPWQRTAAVHTLCLSLVQQSRQADRPAAALRCAVDWARAHEDQFRGRRRATLPSPQCWAGRWERQPTPALNFLGFLPSVLDQVLTERRFEFKSTVAAWRRRGWLRTQITGGILRTRYRTRIDAQNNWYVIAIRPEAITQAEQLAEEL